MVLDTIVNARPKTVAVTCKIIWRFLSKLCWYDPGAGRHVRTVHCYNSNCQSYQGYFSDEFERSTDDHRSARSMLYCMCCNPDPIFIFANFSC